MEPGAVVSWEALNPDYPRLEQARRQYESTLDPAERIPWRWIAHAVAARARWRPGGWSPHMILAAQRRRRGDGPVVGFAYGAHIKDYGGYPCYLGVEPGQRRRGRHPPAPAANPALSGGRRLRGDCTALRRLGEPAAAGGCPGGATGVVARPAATLRVCRRLLGRRPDVHGPEFRPRS